MRTARGAVAGILTALACGGPVRAQDPVSPAPALASPHALVLSGGGSRGLAHAGVLGALEELGYATSFVVGTSMGSIVGALYAAGYDPAQIRRMIAAENWIEHFAAEAVVSGPGREPRRPLLTVGVRRGRFYEGIVPATGVNRHLVELLFDAGVRAHNDFDRLPRRYRAVAVDLATGREVVLGAGDLPRAVRASMAVPGVFAPVYIDGVALVDGGIANNLPVSVADSITDLPVIAVDVLRPDSIVGDQGALDLGVRALRLLIHNARRPAADPAILILPRLSGGLSEARFPADAEPLIAAGARATRDQVQPAMPPARWTPGAPGAAPARLDTLVVTSEDGSVARLVRSMVSPALGPYDPQRVLERVDALYGTALFQAIWPRVERLPDGRVALVVDVTPVAGTTVAGAGGWDNDAAAGAWVTLRQRLSLNTPWELRVSGQLAELGHSAAVDLSAFSQRVPGIAWNAGIFADEEQVRLFRDDSVTGRHVVRTGGGWAGAEAHTPLRGWFASALVRAEQFREPARDNGWSWGPRLRISRAPEPDRIVGIEPVLQLDTRFGTRTFSAARAALEVKKTFGRTRTAAVADVAFSSADAPLSFFPATSRSLAPSLPAGSLRNRLRAVAGLDVAAPLVLDGYARVRGRLYTGAGDIDPLALEHVHAGIEVGAVWPSVLGQIAAAVAFGRGVPPRLNLAVGLTP